MPERGVRRLVRVARPGRRGREREWCWQSPDLAVWVLARDVRAAPGGGAEDEDGRAPQLERLALDGDYYSDGGIEPSEEEEAPGAVQRRERKVTRHTHATGRFFAGCINSAQHVKCCICSGLRPRDPNASTPPLLAQIDYSRFDGLSVSDSEQPEEVCLLACRPAACPCIACGQPLQTFHMLA